MDGAGTAAVVSLGVICVAQQWALMRLVTRLLPPEAPRYRNSAPRASQPRVSAPGYEENRHFRHHPSETDWPTQGDLNA